MGVGAGTSAVGGNLTATAGNTTGALGGSVSVLSGAGLDGSGDVLLSAAAVASQVGGAQSGRVWLATGTAALDADSGDVVPCSGDASGAQAGDAGAVVLSGGAARGGFGGAVRIVAG